MDELVIKIFGALKEVPYRLGLISELTRYGYDVVEGGHCGFCGKWLPDENFKVPKGFDPWPYTWGICKDYRIDPGIIAPNSN